MNSYKMPARESDPTSLNQSTRRSFFSFPLQRYAGSDLSFLSLCPCHRRDHEARPGPVACRSDRFRRRGEEGGRTS